MIIAVRDLNSATIRVLLIQDDAAGTKLVHDSLAAVNYPRFQVASAARLAQGLELLAQKETDVVLLDLTLSEVGGIEAFRQVRARAPDVPIIVLSVPSDQRAGIDAVHEGAQDHMLKSQVNRNSLVRSMRNAIERHRLYSAVEQEKRILTAVQDSIQEMLVVLDSDRRILYFNRAAEEVTGLFARDVLGMSFERCLNSLPAPAFDPPSTRERLLGVVGGSTTGPQTIEFAVLGPRRREMSTTIFPIELSSEERMTGLLARDITQEQEVKRRRNEFISVASHELRTPMTALMGFSELLLDRYVPPDPVMVEWLRIILKESQRLTAIVDDLLNVSRIQSGRLKLRWATLPLQEVIAETLDLIRPTTTKHSFEAEVDPAVSQVVADRSKLAQVLMNLVSNAVKYSPNGGQIAVAARHDPRQDRVVVSVSDQGMGIAPEDRDQLFSTFGRIRRPETDGIRGSGLGLYIVKELLELMGGDIWLESQLNQGSTFLFSLPMAPVGVVLGEWETNGVERRVHD